VIVIADVAGLWGTLACVLRGGSWNNNPRNARAAYRNNNQPDNWNNNNGFRLACAADDSTMERPAFSLMCKHGERGLMNHPFWMSQCGGIPVASGSGDRDTRDGQRNSQEGALRATGCVVHHSCGVAGGAPPLHQCRSARRELDEPNCAFALRSRPRRSLGWLDFSPVSAVPCDYEYDSHHTHVTEGGCRLCWCTLR
jgi:hypothetical protein